MGLLPAFETVTTNENIVAFPFAAAESISLATPAVLLGFDSSYYNHKYGTKPHDWNAIYAGGYRFCAVRFTVGRYYKDPWALIDFDGAKESGVYVAPYHVIVPDQEYEPQVVNFLSLLGSRKPDYRIVIDSEIFPTSDINRGEACFAYHVNNLPRVNSQIPINYSNANWCNSLLKSTHGTDLWVASPGAAGSYNPAANPTKPTIYPKHEVWQRSWTHTIPGIIDTTVDLDEYPGTLADFEAEFGISTAPVPPPPPPAPGLQFKVLVPTLNIRMGPATSYPDVGDLHQGDIVTVQDVAGAGAWIKIGEGQWAAVEINGTHYMDKA